MIAAFSVLEYDMPVGLLTAEMCVRILQMWQASFQILFPVYMDSAKIF